MEIYRTGRMKRRRRISSLRILHRVLFAKELSKLLRTRGQTGTGCSTNMQLDKMSIYFGILLVVCMITTLHMASAQEYDDESNDVDVDKRSMSPGYYYNAGPPRKISGYGKRSYYKSYSNPMKGFGERRYAKRYGYSSPGAGYVRPG